MYAQEVSSVEKGPGCPHGPRSLAELTLQGSRNKKAAKQLGSCLGREEMNRSPRELNKATRISH